MAASPPPDDDDEGMSSGQRWLIAALVILAVVLIGVILALVLSNDDGSDKPKTTTTSSTSSTSTSSTTTSTSRRRRPRPPRRRRRRRPRRPPTTTTTAPPTTTTTAPTTTEATTTSRRRHTRSVDCGDGPRTRRDSARRRRARRRARRRRSATTASATTATTSPRSPTPSSTSWSASCSALADEYPELDAGDSPLAEVGAPPSATFAPVRHIVPMLSLDNAFAREELAAWYARIERVITDPVAFVGEPKLDGSGDLVALRGRVGSCAPAPGATARSGKDVTANVATIDVIPADAAGRCGADPARGAGRGLHAARLVRGAEPAPGRGRRPALRQPAQRRRRQPAPEGPARHRVARPRVRRLPARACRRAVPRCARTTRRSSWLRDLGLPVNEHIEQLPVPRRGLRVLRPDRGATATRSATTSTARW